MRQSWPTSTRGVLDGLAGQPMQAKRRHTTHRNQPFQPLPRPTGEPPFHLSLDDVLPPAEMDAIRSAGKLVFHIMGDTGGTRSPFAQQIVASHLESDVQSGQPGSSAAFLYLLGDIVYYYGQPSEYYAQFFEPYAHYPAPIFGVPGNHDGDLLDGSSLPSLSAFVDNFCAHSRHQTPLAGETARDTMTQPNVYWTLETPFATIVGLYTNVPEGGSLDSDQIAWFHTELEAAPRDRALIVAMHHPVYSADRFHGGSEYMAEILDPAIQKTGRLPDAVFAGHVHNYQRYTRAIGGTRVPYLVVGAGGYWHLHAMQTHYGAAPEPPMSVPGIPDLTLERYCDDRHGFMRVEVTNQTLNARYFTVPRPHERWRDPARLFDEFTIPVGQLAAPAPAEPQAPPAAPAAPEVVTVVAKPTVVGDEMVAQPLQPVPEPAIAAARTSFGGG